jgi:hypothetical protein
MSTAMEQYLQDKVDAERDRREALVKRSYEEKIMKLLNVGEAEAEGGDHRFSQLLEKDFWRKMGPELSISDDPKMATLSAVYGPGKVMKKCYSFYFYQLNSENTTQTDICNM